MQGKTPLRILIWCIGNKIQRFLRGEEEHDDGWLS